MVFWNAKRYYKEDKSTLIKEGGQMYIESRYNYAVKMEDRYLTYNSLSGKIVVGDKRIKDVLDENPEVAEQLFKYKFIVTDERMEKNEALEKYYSYCYEPKLNVILLVTKQCNFRCEYCYEDHKKEEEKIFMNFTKFLQKNLMNYTGLQVSWFGGEPLLRFKEIIEYSKIWRTWCKKVRRPYQASMTTNGYLLSLEYFQALLSVGVTNYQITLDGLAESHDSMRHLINGQGTFDVIYKNLKDIRDFCKRHFNITIRVNVSESVLKHLDDVIEFFWKEFGTDSRFSFFFTLVKNWGGSCRSNMNSELLPGKMENKMYEKMLNHSHVLNYSIYYLALQNGMCFSSQKNSMVIETNAQVNKCTILRENDTICGKINDNGEIYSFKNIPFNRIVYDNEECKGCSFWANCFKRVCPAAAKYDSTNECPSMKTNSEVLLKLLYRVDQQYNLGFLRY